jgi:tetratricopeptide (TPR) repeat protein
MTHNYYGIMLAEHGAYDKAVEQFSAALVPGQHFSGVLGNLYNAGINAGKLDVVLDVIKEWELKTPCNAELYYRAGMIYGMEGDIKKSIEQLEKALEIAKSQANKELTKEIEEQLEQYRQKKQIK